MTLREAARRLGLKVRTLRKWVAVGHIKAVKRSDNSWDIPESEINNEEVQKRAYEGREHSRRIKEGIELGMLARRGEDTQKSIQRTKRKK